MEGAGAVLAAIAPVKLTAPMPAGQNFPAPQGLHATGESVKYPPGHVPAVKTHDAAPATLDLPDAQAAQKVEPAGANVPATHVVHAPGMADEVPAGHVKAV